MEMPRVDVAGALAMASAMGIAPEIAAALVSACAEGARIGLAERKEGAA